MIDKMKLIPDDISPDIRKALEELVKDAREGQLIGLAFVGVYKRREFIVNVAGELRRNPTLARGMVASLDDYLSEQPHR